MAVCTSSVARRDGRFEGPAFRETPSGGARAAKDVGPLRTSQCGLASLDGCPMDWDVAPTEPDAPPTVILIQQNYAPRRPLPARIAQSRRRIDADQFYDPDRSPVPGHRAARLAGHP